MRIVLNVDRKMIGGIGMDWQVVRYDTLDSTNLEAKRKIQQQIVAQTESSLHGMVIVAETQTGGKGRLGRHWESKAGTGLWFTVILKPNVPIEQASFYSFAVAVSVAEAIREVYALPVTLKWPNDVLLSGKKLCGILLELIPHTQTVYELIIGIGVNVNQQLTDFPAELQEKATSIVLELKREQKVDAHLLFTSILAHLQKNCLLLETQGFAAIRAKWKAWSCIIGREVLVLEQGKVSYTGIVDDLAMDGTLLVRTSDGIRSVIAGDISLRTVDGGYTF